MQDRLVGMGADAKPVERDVLEFMAHAPEPVENFLRELPRLEGDPNRLMRMLRDLEGRGLVVPTVEADREVDAQVFGDWWELTARGREEIGAVDAVKWMQLDERARTWARSQLALGKSLAAACGRLVEQGQPWAHIPDASPEWIYHFEGGTAGREWVRKEQPVWLQMWDAPPGEALSSWLLRDDPLGEPVIVYEERLAKASDSGMQDQYSQEQYARGRIRFRGEEVYDCVSRQDLDHPGPWVFGGYPTLGVLTYWPAEHGPVTAPGDLTPDIIQVLAEQSVALLVGAWDEENYLVMDKGFLARVGVAASHSEAG